MAASLRAAMGRAARRVVSEELHTLFRGSRPNPNPAVAAPAEAELVIKKPDVVAAKKRPSSHHATRSTSWVPWLAGAFVTFAFLEFSETNEPCRRCQRYCCRNCRRDE